MNTRFYFTSNSSYQSKVSKQVVSPLEQNLITQSNMVVFSCEKKRPLFLLIYKLKRTPQDHSLFTSPLSFPLHPPNFLQLEKNRYRLIYPQQDLNNFKTSIRVGRYMFKSFNLLFVLVLKF